MDIPLQIAFKDMDSSAFLEAQIRTRVEKLKRVHQAITSCRAVLSIPHRAAASGKLPLEIALEVNIPGHNTLVARDEEPRHDAKQDHTLVINRVFEVMERQLEQANRINKGIVKHHASAPDTGKVVRLLPEQEYGFVEMRDGDLYFSRSAVQGDRFETLSVGTLVEVVRAREDGPMGPQASSIRLREAARAAS
ncbi:HPF/RaiA family ribosome-associated protein [Niveispirillum sp. SYP-B3756]|uniref:HPF/RaiA family ribosome-associated protein n=1 Tax=Niveispirillum sp. SYP-B3756 TaxID=2662178 RepID=UPI001566FA46|nr:HPF/RaiA family ribosome-associated protein [Niveispirillum sp. SYP-B3756]